ncbi:MAG: HDOD domain-containing protein [Myxococcota bacterium]
MADREELEPIVLDDDLFERRVRVPALPGVVNEVYQRIQSGTADPASVAAILDRDAVFSAHVLKVVNSAYFGLPVAVTTVRFAIAYLGLSEVSRIALALSVMKVLNTEQRSLMESFWVRSYHTALISRKLAKRLTFSAEDAENLYLAALLHDVGKLVYAAAFPDHFKAVTQYCRDHGCRAVEAQKALGFPEDGELGLMVSRYWNLPKAVRRACAAHELEDLEQVKSRDQADPLQLAVCVASLLSVLCVYPLTDVQRVRISREIQRVMEMDQDDFLLLMSDVYDLRDEARRTVMGLL